MINGIAVKILDSTKLKSSALVQLSSLTAPKFTFNHTPVGKYGVPDSTNSSTNFVASYAYTVLYVGTLLTFQAIWEPV